MYVKNGVPPWWVGGRDLTPNVNIIHKGLEVKGK